MIVQIADEMTKSGTDSRCQFLLRFYECSVIRLNAPANTHKTHCALSLPTYDLLLYGALQRWQNEIFFKNFQKKLQKSSDDYEKNTKN